MKTRWIQLIAGFTLLVLCISIHTTTSNATVVWEDNFDDGNYDGWTMSTVFNPTSHWNATNHYLQIEQDDPGTITHPSNIAYGNWSFDFRADDTRYSIGSGAGICFISSALIQDNWSCYWIQCMPVISSGVDKIQFSLYKWHGGVSTLIDAYDTHLSIQGWHHIEVTRTTAGLFSVYYNESVVMQGVDTEIDTSELFVVNMAHWSMIDNIVVDDEFPAAPLPWELIILGVGVAAVVIVIAIVILRRR